MMTQAWAVFLRGRISTHGALFVLLCASILTRCFVALKSDGETLMQVDWSGSAGLDDALAQASSRTAELGGVPEATTKVGLSVKAISVMAEVDTLQRRLIRRRGERDNDSIDGDFKREDCDQSPYNSTVQADSSKRLTGFKWILRLVQPCKEEFYKSGDAEWEINQLTLHTSPCSNASTDNVATPWRVHSSGQAKEGFNTDLAFDGDMSTAWRGVQDSAGELWVEARYQKPVEIQCIRFFQCNCARSARAVAVEASATSSENWEWEPVQVQKVTQFGEWTTVDI